MIKKVDHATMVVSNLEDALKSFENILHLTPEGGFHLTAPGMSMAMLPTSGGARIELLGPDIKGETRFARFLRERGEGVFGLSIFLDNFDEEVKSLRGKGVTIEEDYQAFLFPENPFRIAWIPAEACHGVWIELVDWNALPDFEK